MCVGHPVSGVRYWSVDGIVLRLRFLTADPRCFVTKGGLQRYKSFKLDLDLFCTLLSSCENRKEKEHRQILDLAKEFPEFVKFESKIDHKTMSHRFIVQGPPPVWTHGVPWIDSEKQGRPGENSIRSRSE